jgi:hypothetical protein
MKYKFKKIWAEHEEGFVLGIALFGLLGVMLSLLWVKHDEKRDILMESTSEKSIRAELFDYKGHQYILFEESRAFGASSFLHNPDCKKCKFAQ